MRPDTRMTDNTARRRGHGCPVSPNVVPVSVNLDQYGCACPMSVNRPRLGFLIWDEEFSMTQDLGSTVPFAWFEGWLVSLKIAQMTVSRFMAIMLTAVVMVSG